MKHNAYIVSSLTIIEKNKTLDFVFELTKSEGVYCIPCTNVLVLIVIYIYVYIEVPTLIVYYLGELDSWLGLSVYFIYCSPHTTTARLIN